MKKWLGPIALCTALAVITHAAIVYFAPSFIMARAMTMLEKRDTPLHGFSRVPRMTPQTQSVVRASPDLTYAACRFDLAQAPNGIRVTMAAYDSYSSLSFFDARTNNFLTVRGDGEQRQVTLLPPHASGAGAIVAPSDTGIILIRRLAPTDDAYAKVVELSVNDSCEAL